MIFKEMLFTCLVITTVLKEAQGFLFANTCPNTVQCSCVDWSAEVVCISRGLQTVPTFHHTTTFNRLRLENNAISKVGANSFSSFQCNGGPFFLNLANNRIVDFDVNAFNGINYCKLTIDLSNNQLTGLPEALQRVYNLVSLNLKGNPLFRLDPTTMSVIGFKVTEFRVDIGRLNSWPTELTSLQHVEKLEISGIPFTQIDPSTFASFNKMEELTIVESKLQTIPTALCGLKNITSVNVSSNYHFKNMGYDMFNVCGQMNLNDSRVKHFFIYDNRVNMFPDVMKMFPNVAKLGMSANGMILMNEDELSSNSSLRSISLSKNGFTRIPYAVNKFVELAYLDLSGNKITTIEEYDLNGLAKLSVLDLDYNPLEYITHEAFTHTPELTTLYLAGTKLRRIPEAATRLAHLNYLTLHNGLVQCSCDMPYVKQWNFGRVYFRNATCYGGGQLIKQFLNSYASVC